VALKGDPSVRSPAQMRAVGRVATSTRFFMTLDDADREQLTRRIRHQFAHPNSVLMERGDEADKFYIVLHGQLQVSVDGRVLATKSAGDAFGEMALLSKERRSADVIAMTACDLAILERQDYLEVVQEKQNAKMALKMSVLQANPYLRCLTDAQRRALAKSGKLQRFSGGE